MPASSILLLATPQSYRLAAFRRAASLLEARVTIGLDAAPGMRSADPSTIHVPFADLPASVALIADRLAGAPPGAVVAVDDSAAELAQALAAVFALAANEPGSEIAGRDKAVMRERFAHAGLPGPRRVVLAPNADPHQHMDQVGYPLVVKPTRLNGSRGVIRANDPRELDGAFARTVRIVLSEGFAADDVCLLLEQFIPGFEVAVEGVMTDGALTVLALFDKPDPLDGPFFEETIYVTPSRLAPSVQRAIHDTTEVMARAVGIRHGPVHAELRINDDGIWPIEIAARSIGGLCSTVLEFGSGMGLEDVIVRHALGEPVGGHFAESQAAGVMMIPIPRSGILRHVRGTDQALLVPGVTGVEISAPLNAPIMALPEGSSYLGFIFARGEAPEQVEAALRSAHSLLGIGIDPMVIMQAV